MSARKARAGQKAQSKSSTLSTESVVTDTSRLEREIEAERGEIFLIMNLVDVVRDALGQDDFLPYYEVLGLAHRKLNKVAAHLETIHSGRGSLS